MVLGFERLRQQQRDNLGRLAHADRVSDDTALHIEAADLIIELHLKGHALLDLEHSREASALVRLHCILTERGRLWCQRHIHRHGR